MPRFQFRVRYVALLLLLGLPIAVSAQFNSLTPFAGTSTDPLLVSIRNIVNAF